MMHIEMFPPSAILLQHEVSKHPRLLMQLSSLGENSTLEERIAVIALYCGMVLDGAYVEKELEHLFELMIENLRKKSVIIVAPSYTIN